MSDLTLSILVTTQPQRARQLARLLSLLHEQAKDKAVEILTDASVGPSTGAKRNLLLHRSKGVYVCFIDDDDLVSDDYVDKVLEACESKCDCCSITGLVVFDKRPSKPFINSLAYTRWDETATHYTRSPNHLNAVKRELAIAAGFPDVSVGEDHEYSKRLQPKLRSCTEIPEILYHYFSQPGVRASAASLRFLIKWPTRSRPKLFKQTFSEHLRMLSGKHLVRWVVSLDDDDPTRGEIQSHLAGGRVCIEVGPAGRGKIAAINAGIPTDNSWDVLVLLADDMLPVEKNWDERIVTDMARKFPHLDGLLVYDDGFQAPPMDPGEVPVAVMPVMGRKFYDR